MAADSEAQRMQAQQLVARIAVGDRDAFTRFYELYERRLFRFILSRLNDPFEAADIQNEVFLEVWRSAGRYQGRASVTSWLFGIAFHKSVDRMRRARPEVHDDQADERIDDAPAPDEVLAAAENAEHVRRCLETLSAAHREVVVLAFFEDLSYVEIAAIVDCPEGTVKTRMYHAKQLLKRCLGQWLGAGS